MKLFTHRKQVMDAWQDSRTLKDIILVWSLLVMVGPGSLFDSADAMGRFSSNVERHPFKVEMAGCIPVTGSPFSVNNNIN